MIETNFSVKENYRIVQSKIKEAAKKANRNLNEIHVIAVTKTIALPFIQEAVDAGISEIGENRIQEAKEKWPSLESKTIPHFIGHLQRNKAKEFTGLCQIIHSLDKLSTANTIEQSLQKRIEQNSMPFFKPNPYQIETGQVGYFIQVNTTDEKSKSGIYPRDLPAFIEQLLKLPHLKPLGLMTIGPTVGGVANNRRAFAHLYELLQKAKLISPHFRFLSMGMSGDYLEAILEGATHLRIGSSIFGNRNYLKTPLER